MLDELVRETGRLAERFEVVAVDVSGEPMLARAAVPSAEVVHADLGALDSPAESFDGELAFLWALAQRPARGPWR